MLANCLRHWPSIKKTLVNFSSSSGLTDIIELPSLGACELIHYVIAHNRNVDPPSIYIWLSISLLLGHLWVPEGSHTALGAREPIDDVITNNLVCD